MKWPHMLSLQRHGESAYNELDAIKKEDLTYKDFARVFDREWAEVRKDNTRILTGDFPSSQLIDLARKAIAITKLPYTDAQTPLTEEGERQAYETGLHLIDYLGYIPDVILVSPYTRTRDTWDFTREGAEGRLTLCETIFERRVREQEHGLRTFFNDFRLAKLFNPLEGLQSEIENRHTHRFLGGESFVDVEARAGETLDLLIREYSEKTVHIVSHHLFILALMSKIERWSETDFLEKNKHQRPRNCGITVYQGIPSLGRDGKLDLVEYDKVLWT